MCPRLIGISLHCRASNKQEKHVLQYPVGASSRRQQVTTLGIIVPMLTLEPKRARGHTHHARCLDASTHPQMIDNPQRADQLLTLSVPCSGQSCGKLWHHRLFTARAMKSGNIRYLSQILRSHIFNNFGDYSAQKAMEMSSPSGELLTASAVTATRAAVRDAGEGPASTRRCIWTVGVAVPLHTSEAKTVPCLMENPITRHLPGLISKMTSLLLSVF